MLMSNNDKKGGMVAMIVKKMGKGSEKLDEMPEKDGAEQDHEMGEDMAVEEMFAAIESKDKAKFKEALDSFIELCFAKHESEPHDEMESDETEQE